MNIFAALLFLFSTVFGFGNSLLILADHAPTMEPLVAEASTIGATCSALTQTFHDHQHRIFLPGRPTASGHFSCSDLFQAPETTGEIIEHGSQRAARRAADRDAGMGKHGGREQLPALRPGFQATEGPRGVRTETRSTDTGNTVHHDPNGTRYNDGTATPPHYGVDTPGQPTRHHTYPTDHNPKTNR